MAQTAVTLEAMSRPTRAGSRRHGTARLGRRGNARSQFALVAWTLILIAFVVSLGLTPTAHDRVPSGQTASTSVRVSETDTLWSIAAAHRLPGVSTARMVELISDANSLSQGSLKTGAVLSVPIEAISAGAYAQAEGTTASR